MKVRHIHKVSAMISCEQTSVATQAAAWEKTSRQTMKLCAPEARIWLVSSNLSGTARRERGVRGGVARERGYPKEDRRK